MHRLLMRMDENRLIYHIYGRKAYTQPLAFIDRLPLDDLSRLSDEVLTRAGRRDEWVELIAFPETSIVRVIPRGDER
jgi:hypothetical protein